MDAQMTRLLIKMHEACTTLILFTPEKAYLEFVKPFTLLSQSTIPLLYMLFQFNDELKPTEKYAFHKRSAYHDTKQYLQQRFYRSQGISVLPLASDDTEVIQEHARYIKTTFEELTERHPTQLHLSTLIGVYTVLMTYWERVEDDIYPLKIQQLFSNSLFYGKNRSQAHDEVVNSDNFPYEDYVFYAEHNPHNYLDLIVTLSEFYRFQKDAALDEVFLLALNYITFCLSEAKLRPRTNRIDDPDREAATRMLEVIQGAVLTGIMPLYVENVTHLCTDEIDTPHLLEQLSTHFGIELSDVVIKPSTFLAVVYQTARSMDTVLASQLFTIVDTWFNTPSFRDHESAETLVLTHAQTMTKIYHHFPRKEAV